MTMYHVQGTCRSLAKQAKCKTLSSQRHSGPEADFHISGPGGTPSSRQYGRTLVGVDSVNDTTNPKELMI